MAVAFFVAVLLSNAPAGDLPSNFTLPPPPGPYVGHTKPEAAGRSFALGTPVIATTYFYWYDSTSNSHVLKGDCTDALTDHPPTLEGFSYKNVDWHAGELRDMIAAGIDVVLPVYWGVPDTAATWSDEGLPKLVAGRRRVLRKGEAPPAIGLFYDTSTLRFNGKGYHVDLTKPAGQLWFYGTIRNFFSLVPPEDRACIDQKPLVLLYSHGFAKALDEGLFPAVRRMFRADFGTDLYLVKMPGWPGDADSQYQWGAALWPRIDHTAALGPGYDHSAVPGRRPLVRPRDNGRFYCFAWERLLRMDPGCRPWLVHLETWNEFHEGTEICETTEYGRQYIELTREYGERFHARKRLGPSEGQPRPEIVSASPAKCEGLKLVALPDGDGPVVQRVVAGKSAWCTTQNRHSDVNRYLYFDVDYVFMFDADEPVEVSIGYFDEGPEQFQLQYDSSDPSLQAVQQQFRAGPTQRIEASKTWKEVTLRIPHARFAGRTNGCDFRIACKEADLSISHVAVRRAPPIP